jgi:hypothetical protein
MIQTIWIANMNLRIMIFHLEIDFDDRFVEPDMVRGWDVQARIEEVTRKINLD